MMWAKRSKGRLAIIVIGVLLQVGLVAFVITQVFFNRAAFLRSVQRQDETTALGVRVDQQQRAIDTIEARCTLSLKCNGEICDLMLTCPGALPANLGQVNQ